LSDVVFFLCKKILKRVLFYEWLNVRA